MVAAAASHKFSIIASQFFSNLFIEEITFFSRNTLLFTFTKI